jgi:predicted metal-dependent TIM-barrel fold hydrolase
MRLFDPHIHMTSRTTDDYQAVAAAGIAALRGVFDPLKVPKTSKALADAALRGQAARVDRT